MRKIYLSIPFLILCDFLSKQWASIYLEDRVNILTDLFYLEFVKNTGIAFSLPVSGVLLKAVTVVLIFCIIAYYIKEEKKKNSLLIDGSFVLIVSGALGNAHERIFSGEVIDFIGVKYFAVFNLADSFITIGALLYIYHLLISKK